MADFVGIAVDVAVFRGEGFVVPEGGAAAGSSDQGADALAECLAKTGDVRCFAVGVQLVVGDLAQDAAGVVFELDPDWIGRCGRR